MAGETLPAHNVFNGFFVLNFPLASHSVPINVFESDNGAPVLLDWVRTAGYKSLHPGGANFVMGDGSVAFYEASIDHRIFAALGTKDGQETLQ